MYYQSPDIFVPYDIRLYVSSSYPTPHFHDRAELLTVLSGEVALTVSRRTEIIRAGECALVLPMRVHSFESEPGTRVWVHTFAESSAPAFFNTLGEKSAASCRFLCKNDALSYYRAVCLDETAGDGCPQVRLSEKLASLSPLRLRSALYAVLSDYLDGAELTENERSGDELYLRVMNYISLHAAEDLSLGSVAAAFGYEPHYLCRILSRVSELNFRRLVNHFRMERAMRLLETTGMSVTEIALTCGYGCLRTFNRVFREFRGMTPLEYRKNAVK